MTDTISKHEGSSLSDTEPVPASEKASVVDAEIGLSNSTSAPPPAFTVPDGGLEAWLVVAGGWLILFAGFGYVNAFGVYEAHYIKTLGASASAVAWIGSIQLCLQFFMGFIVGKLFDEGYGRLVILVGSIIYTFAIFMTSLCKTYWQVLLAQGVAAGIGLGMLFLPALAVVSHWFQRRRALATGIVMSGSSVGGIAFPIMLNNLVQKIGYASAVRASAYLILGCLVVANLLIKTRIPGRKKRPAHMQFPAPDMKAIVTHKAYLLTMAGVFLIMFGLFLPLVYIQVFAESRGLSKSLAFYSISIVNVASAIGRTTPMVLADRFGVLNTLIAAGLGTGVAVFCWLPATGPAGVIVFCLFFGFFSGAHVSLVPAAFQGLSSHVGEVGARMGLAWAVLSIAALVGTPIDGALLGPERVAWWKPTVFAGVSTLVGTAILVAARRLHASAKGTWKV